MQISNILSILRRMGICVVITAACLSLSVTAADDNQTTSYADELYEEQLTPQVESISREVSEQEEPIEEIMVTGQRIILNLRQQIIQAEDHAFEIFNALNDDDMYDIHCRMEAQIGSNIKKRLCLPNYYHRATANNALEYLSSIVTCGMPWDGCSAPISPTISTPVKLVSAYRQPIFKEKVKELAKENPELLDELKGLFELNEELKKKRNAYHGFDDE